MSIDFSYTATRIARGRYENNLTLGVNGQGRKAVHHLVAIKQQAG